MFFPRQQKNLSLITPSCLLALLLAFAGCAENSTDAGELLVVDSDLTGSVEGTVEVADASFSVALDMELITIDRANRIAEVAISVFDTKDAPVPGLLIAGSFQGAGIASVTGITDLSGQVLFESPVFGEADWMGFELQSVTHAPTFQGIETSPPCDRTKNPDCQAEQGEHGNVVAPIEMKGIETSPPCDPTKSDSCPIEPDMSADGIETSPPCEQDPTLPGCPAAE